MQQPGKLKREVLVYPCVIQWNKDHRPGLHISCLGLFQSVGGHFCEYIATSVVIHVIHEGQGDLYCNGNHFDFSKGAFSLFRPGDHVRYFDQTHAPWNYTWLELQGTEAERAVELTGIGLKTVTLDMSAWKSFSSFLSRISKVFSSRQYPMIFPIVAAWECISEIAQECGRNVGLPSVPDVATECRDYIEKHPSPYPSIKEMATHFNIHRSTLFRNFKERYSRNPKDYIDDLRMKKARQMLLLTKRQVKEIAFACGFKESNYFIRVFKRRFGCTPTALRKNDNLKPK